MPGWIFTRLSRGLKHDDLIAWPVEGFFFRGHENNYRDCGQYEVKQRARAVPASEGGMDDAASGDENQIQEDAE